MLIDKTPSYSKKIQHSEWGRGVKELRKSFVDAVNSSKGVSVAGYSKSDEVEFYAFGTFNGYTSKKGNTFFYDNEKSWLNDLKKINSMNPANEFQMRKGDDNSKEKVEGGTRLKVSGNQVKVVVQISIMVMVLTLGITKCL